MCYRNGKKITNKRVCLVRDNVLTQLNDSATKLVKLLLLSMSKRVVIITSYSMRSFVCISLESNICAI